MEVQIVVTIYLLASFLVADGCLHGCSCRPFECSCYVNRRRRSLENPDWEEKGSCKRNGTHYNIMLQHGPCNFNSYDVNLDGEITRSELRDLFGTNEETDALFVDLDVIADDGVIKPKEFRTMAFRIISECMDGDK